MLQLANGKQQFLDQNGAPLAGGLVYHYAPSTTNPVATYKDSAATSANTNPIQLDSRGQAVIWGTGTFRQVVTDTTGNLIWDQTINAPDVNAPATALQSQIAGPTGAAMVGFLQPGPGAVKRIVRDKLSERVSVTDFGADPTGVADSTAAIQACIDYCAGDNGKLVYFPAGNYTITAALEVPSFAHISGCGPSKSRINLQNKPYTGPILVNATADAFQFVTIRDLGLRGGSYGIYNTAATQEHLLLDNVSFELQTQAGIYSAHDWQINTLRNVTFYYCFQGIYVAGGFANHNNYYAVEFLGITGASYRCESSNEGNNFYGCRFEAGGLVGNIVLQVANNRNTNFFGGYFENTHNILLRERGGFGTRFDGVHFTGAIAGAQPFFFDSDSEVTFGPNSWTIPCDGPLRLRITGDNGGKLGKNNKLTLSATGQHQKFIASNIAISAPGATVPLIAFARTITDGSIADLQAGFGMLAVIFRRTTTTGLDATYAAQIPITINGIAGGPMSVNIGAAVIGQNTLSEILSVSATALSNTTGTLQVDISGMDAGAIGFLSWSFEMLSGFNPNYKSITAALP